MTHIKMDVSLDPTLGCGQAHRWRKLEDGSWQGVLGHDIVTLTQADDGFDCSGTSDIDTVKRYFREEDNLKEIIREISERDPEVASLSSKCPGMRILRQPEWECLATYVLATNVNIKRITKMIELVCDTFGTDLGTRHAFPTPRQILDRKELIGKCRLGFREARFIELAQRIYDKEIDLRGMKELKYGDLTNELQMINGVGPKVADCVALFGYGRLEAFPVDVRIQRCLREIYGIEGNYRTTAEFGRRKFGRYAGYAQELLYHMDFIK